jgi:hypothetical protein
MCLFFSGCSDPPAGDEHVDFDLSVLGNTVLSAKVNRIMRNPVDYLDKTIKVSGVHSFVFFNDRYHHYVLTQYGDDCCIEGFEIKWGDVHVYPDDYPENQVRIEVIGIYSSYQDNGLTRFYLAVDSIVMMP